MNRRSSSSSTKFNDLTIYDRTSRVIHSLSMIEDALEPLIRQTTSPQGESQRRSKSINPQKKLNVFKLVETLVYAIDAFINSSSQIFKDYTELSSEILVEIENLRSMSRRYKRFSPVLFIFLLFLLSPESVLIF